MSKIRSAVPNDGPAIKVISYWPKGDYGHTACFIKHTSHGDSAYIAGCQKDDPSACVWHIPGTEQ